MSRRARADIALGTIDPVEWRTNPFYRGYIKLNAPLLVPDTGFIRDPEGAAEGRKAFLKMVLFIVGCLGMFAAQFIVWTELERVFQDDLTPSALAFTRYAVFGVIVALGLGYAFWARDDLLHPALDYLWKALVGATLAAGVFALPLVYFGGQTADGTLSERGAKDLLLTAPAFAFLALIVVSQFRWITFALVAAYGAMFAVLGYLALAA
ncbi:MAG: hypothetical protein AAF714_06875 [Pseudomonadota bacterium]